MTTLQQIQQELKALSEKVEKALEESQYNNHGVVIRNSYEVTGSQPIIKPFEGTKRVRITGYKDEQFWYANQIDHLFNVEYFTPERYICTEGGTILSQDCTEVQPQQPWEKYPTFESCNNYNFTWGLNHFDGNIYGNIYDNMMAEYSYPTEALAKYSRAIMILSTVAKKWNEGVEIKYSSVWFPSKRRELKPMSISIGSDYEETIPFYFHSEELCQKSIELFPNEWQDFFNAKG